MANYTAVARSNYFEVRDEEAFIAWVATLPGVVAEKETEGDGGERFVLLGADGDCGGWPSFRSRGDGLDADEEIDLPTELSGHLAEGSVAVLEEAGGEKLRFHEKAVLVKAAAESFAFLEETR